MTNRAPFVVAAVQFNPRLNDREHNLAALYEIVERAANAGAKLIVTPEMATTGYSYPNRAAIAPFVDTIPGVTTELFAELTRQYNVYVVVGMPEVELETNFYYNSAVLIGPKGVVGCYRKIHLWEVEAHWALSGNLGVPVFDTDIGKIAINICMDANYFESARLAALGGANILAFPTNSSLQTISILQARAEENGLFIVSANRSNTEQGFHMVGASAIWSPFGEKLAEADFVPSPEQDIHESTVIYATIDPTLYDNPARRRFIQRRPALYKELMLHIAPWNNSANQSSQHVKVAAIQYEPILKEKAKNLVKIKGMISQCVAQGKSTGKEVDLVVLPELCFTGVDESWGKDEMASLADDLNSVYIRELVECAMIHQIYVVAGFIERDRDRLYNSAILISPHGTIVGVHRKTHLNQFDRTWAMAGDQVDVFSINIGRIGILIGSEVLFPELSGLMAVKRADILTIPSSWRGEFGNRISFHKGSGQGVFPEGVLTMWNRTALDTQAYTIVSNFVGTVLGFQGTSAVYMLDPLYSGEVPVIAPTNCEEVLIAEFDTLHRERWFNQDKLISSRRTPSYIPITI
ncbi:nitrilase-related carbon-nitrogen hydrolase [Alicyclobacillus shizuokensis]|uniref:nitrilase-related carbon-nitrogen hydrolase n=1 Tax=Alicyclobacillus shizuokensis TaxID=392014 RepID=UPI0008304227|nr:nitrilase-related carbon-nitrogen hydrolase [Alicyclobacillus shizuokensis]